MSTHFIYDASTGEEKTVPLTPEEEAERELWAKEAGDLKSASDKDMAIIKERAGEDRAFAALARVLGVIGAD